jgi:hypothetical protein
MCEPASCEQIQEHGLHFVSEISPPLKLSENVDYLWKRSHPYLVRHQNYHATNYFVWNNRIRRG